MALNHEGTYYVALRLIAWNSLSVDNHPVATLRSPDPHSPGLLLVFDSKEAARAFFDEDVALVALCTGSAATPKEIAVRNRRWS